MKNLFVILLLSCYGLVVNAQDTMRDVPMKRGYSKEPLGKKARDLTSSLKEKDDRASAQLYEEMANDFIRKGDYARAEHYLSQALAIYTDNKDKKNIARIKRSIAKVQEQQDNIKGAITNYEQAAAVAPEKKEANINRNDAARLRNPNDFNAQKSYLNTNIELLEEPKRSEEVADAYQQLAETELQQNNIQEAADKYQKAIEATRDEDKKVAINRDLAEVYASEKQYSEAIRISEHLLEEAKSKQDKMLEIQQLLQLSGYYTKSGDKERPLALLQEAYRLAIQSNDTRAAKSVTEAIAVYYEDKQNYKGAGEAYRNFVKDLDNLIARDSGLIDARIFEVTENRIKELEKERALQRQIIKNKNIFNYFLIGSVALMLLLLAFIGHSLNAIKRRNKKIALQSLRREMNPHFIFNSLNSVNQFIAENNELQANKYLTSYSGLMRNVMEHSNKDFVTLTTEAEQLQKYLELEHLRFKDKFDYNIFIDDVLDTDTVLIPNMLIQPHLENAIWHGLRYKDTKGTLSLGFYKADKRIKVVIADDGIGIAQSKAMKTFHQKAHRSRGMSNTLERISLLNELYKCDISIEVKDRTDNQTGTIVTIIIPLMDKKYAQQ